MTTHDIERVQLTVNGLDLEVVGLLGEERLSELFTIRITCKTKSTEVDPASLVAGEAAITLSNAFEDQRVVTGLVTEAQDMAHEDGTAILELIVRPKAYPLTLGRDCRVFQDMSVAEVTRDVLSRGGVPQRWDITGTYAPQVYVAQYRESDWRFVTCRLAAAGIYFWFDHAGGSTTVFADSSAAAPDIAGLPVLRFAFESDAKASEDIVSELGACSTMVPNAFAVGSFDPMRPDTPVTASGGAGGFEIYRAPGAGPADDAGCAALVALGAEGAAAAGAGIAGKTTSVRLAPGLAFSVAGHDQHDGTYLVTAVRYEVTQRRRDKDTPSGYSYTCFFEGIDKSVTYRPPALPSTAKQAGLQSGVVVGAPGEEIYTRGSGEVRFQLHWDRIGGRDDKAGRWVRVAQRGTAESMLLPRMGWNVLSYNTEGSTDEPRVLNRVHDAEHPPAYPLPANKTRVVFKTATTPGGGTFNEYYFEDRQGAEEMFINASRDMKIRTHNVKSEVISRDSLRVVAADVDTTIGYDLDQNVMSNQSIAIGGDEEFNVSGDRSKAVAANETVTVGSTRKVQATDGHDIVVEGTRSLSVGAALIDATLGTISSHSSVAASRLIGGVSLKATSKTLTEDVGGLTVQTIGGIKLEISGSDRTTDVKDTYTETIGMLMMLDTDTSYIDSADETATWTAGQALDGSTPELFVEAEEKIELICGGSKIVIVPEGVEIVAKNFDMTDAATLETVTAVIEHN